MSKTARGWVNMLCCLSYGGLISQAAMLFATMVEAEMIYPLSACSLTWLFTMLVGGRLAIASVHACNKSPEAVKEIRRAMMPGQEGA